MFLPGRQKLTNRLINVLPGLINGRPVNTCLVVKFQPQQPFNWMLYIQGVKNDFLREMYETFSFSQAEITFT